MSNQTDSGLQRLVILAHRIEDSLLVVLLTAMIVLAISQIVLRNLFDTGMFWSDPLVRALVLWLGLLGAMVGARDDNHIRIDILSRFLPSGIKRISGSVTALFTAAVCGVLAFHGARLVLMDWEAQSTVCERVPAWLVEAIMPFGFGVMAVRYLLFSALRWRSSGERAG